MYDILPTLGRIYLEENKLDEIQSLLEKPKAQYYIIITLHINEDGNVTHHELTGNPYDYWKVKEHIWYRKPPSKGSGILPTALLTEPEKTLNDKIIAWFKKQGSIESGFSRLESVFKVSQEYLETNSKDIVINLEDLRNELLLDFKKKRRENKKLPQNPNILLTIEYRPDPIQDLLKDYLRSNLLKEVTTKYYKMSYGTSKGRGVCYYCGETKEVYGFASPFKFYTHDKINFAPELDTGRAWYQFPVCVDCAIHAEKGRVFIETKLKFKMHGVEYFLIPQVLHDEDLSYILDILSETYTEEDAGGSNDESKTTSIRKNITGGETEILEELSEMSNLVTLTFMFFRKNNSQEEILALVPDVLPSRLSELFQAKESLDENPFFKDIWYHLRSEPLNFSFKFVRDLFPKTPPGEISTSDEFIQAFLAYVSAALAKSSVSETTLINQAIRMLQHRFVNRQEGYWNIEFRRLVFEYFLVREFYKLIGCLEPKVKNTSDVKMTTKNDLLGELSIEGSDVAKNALEFFEQSEYYDHPMKRGAFLVGMLARRVVYEQWRSLHSEPFYEKLFGLRLNQRLLRRLLPETMAKLREYKAITKNVAALETLSSYYLGQNNPEHESSVSNDDISFSFASGLALSYALFKKVGEIETMEEN